MRMPFLALAVRSLRVESRSARTYLLRGLLVTVLILSLWTAQTTARILGAPGLQLFSWLTSINFLFVTVLGVSMFSSVITEEKEQMTLGLLEMAGFNALSILLGKSIGQLLSALMLLAVQLPFALLAVTLGGVSSHQVMAAYTILLAYTLFVYGVALLSSVVCSRTTAAARLTGLVVFGFLLLPWFGRLLLGLMWGSNPGSGMGAVLGGLLDFLGSASAYSALSVVARTGFSEPLLGEAVQLNLALAAIGVFLAWLLFPLCNRQAGSAAPARGSSLWSALRSRRGRPAPAAGALVWKDFHFMVGGRVGIWGRVLVYGLLFLILGLSIQGQLPPGFRGPSGMNVVGTTMTPIMVLCVVLELSLRSSRVFNEEIKWRTLSGLVLLPFSMNKWAYGKLWAHGLLVLPAVGYLVLAIVMLMADQGLPLDGLLFLGIFFLFSNVFLFAHLAVYLSLFLRRGAFAVTLVGYVVAYMMIGIAITGCLGLGDPEAMLVILGIVMIGAALLIHGFIGRKLREVAAR